MGLFNKSQIDKINNVAKKSKIVNQSVSNTKISSVNDELIRSSKAVEEYFKDSPAILITSKPQLHEYVTAAISAGIVGIDTETTGLDRNKDYIVGASLYYPGGVECYIALKHRVPVFETYYKNQISYEDLADELQRFVDTKTKLVFANANYDLYMLWKDLRVDLDPAFYYDVILAWRCLKEDELHNDLKHLYVKYVLKGEGDPKRFSDFFSPKLFPYSKPDVAKLYAANDAKITYDLYVWQFQYSNPNSEKCKQHHLENISTLIWDIEFPLVHICQTIERNGMYVDQDMGKVLQTKYHEIYDEELNKLKGMVDEVIEKNPQPMTSKKPPFTSGNDFNPKSTMHVQYLLYTLMGVPKVNGKMATGKEILNELDMPIATQIARVRSLSTNINTFVDKLPNSVAKDGKIHADFKQIGAATGRLSSSNPNLMNIPSRLSDIRHLFRADPKHIDKIIGNEINSIVKFTVHNFAKLVTSDGELKFVKDLRVGDSVIVNNDGTDQAMKIESIDESIDNQSILSFEMI